MKKIIRLIKEFFYALRFYKNSWTYFFDRVGFFNRGFITLRLWGGAKYKIHAGTNEIRMFNEIWHWGIYDPLLKYVRDGGTIVDIGANIGIFTIRAARQFPKSKVISYEPLQENFRLLKENIDFNNLRERVVPINLAVAGGKGEVDFFIHNQDSGGGSIYRHGDDETIKLVKVKTVSLVDVFESNGITECDFMKMDCEGSEEEILYNAPSDIIRKIRNLTIEWHDDLSKLGFKKFERFLINNGYQVNFDKKTGTLYARQ